MTLSYERQDVNVPKPLLHYNTGDYPRICNTESFDEASKIIYEKMSKIYYPFFENVKQINSINVFYDTGSGFSEYEKDVFYHFPVELNVGAEVRSIKIKPCSRFCIVKDISIKVDAKDLPFTTNAYRQDGGTFYFDTDDPQICLSSNIRGRGGNFCMTVFYLDAETSGAIRTDWEKAIKKSEFEASFLQSEAAIKNMQNSRSWKITKPLRWAGKIARKIFRR